MRIPNVRDPDSGFLASEFLAKSYEDPPKLIPKMVNRWSTNSTPAPVKQKSNPPVAGGSSVELETLKEPSPQLFKLNTLPLDYQRNSARSSIRAPNSSLKHVSFALFLILSNTFSPYSKL